MEEYMKNAKRPGEIKQQLGKVLEDLKTEKVSKKLASFFEEMEPITGTQKMYAYVLPKCETLYDYVNEENAKRILAEAQSLFQSVEVMDVGPIIIGSELCTWN